MLCSRVICMASFAYFEGHALQILQIPVQHLLTKNGRVSSCYHGHRNVYLLRMHRHPHSLLFIN